MQHTLRMAMSALLIGALLSACASNQERVQGSSGTVIGDSDTAATATGSQTDSRRTKTEGTVLGALVGGLLGYALGDGKGAAVGALLGAGLGYSVGNEIAKRKQQYASNEEFLDAEIARTAEFNATARAHHNKMLREIAILEKETTRLRAVYASGKASKAQVSAKKAELEDKLARNRDFEETLQQEYEICRAILEEERKSLGDEDPSLAKLEKENADLRTQIEALQQDSAQLAQINERLSV